MAQSSLDELDLVIKTMAKTIVDNADYFAQLDSIVGDGDFGYSLRNGFEVVARRLRRLGPARPPARSSRRSALTLSGKVGGVCGPMWGTAFLRAGASGRRQGRSSPPRTSSRCSGPRSTGSWHRGGAAAGRQDAARRARPGDGQPRGEHRGSGDRRRPRRRRDPAGRGRRRQGGRGHQADARHARPRRLHGRAEHRLGGRRRHRDRGHSPGHQRRVAREVRERNRRIEA